MKKQFRQFAAGFFLGFAGFPMLTVYGLYRGAHWVATRLETPPGGWFSRYCHWVTDHTRRIAG